MFLNDVKDKKGESDYDARIEAMRQQGFPVPEIWHLFAFKPKATEYLARFTQEVMRGDSPLSPGMRELIAAFTSRQNSCPF